MSYVIQRGDVAEEEPTFLSTKGQKERWVNGQHLYTPMRFATEETAAQVMLNYFGKDCPHKVVPEENHAD